MVYFGKTDVGIKRKNNQDTFRVFSAGGADIAVVCDGMGGAAGGGVASKLACDEFVSSLTVMLNTVDIDELPDSEIINMLLESGTASNKVVYENANEYADLEGMGTTLVACLYRNGKLYVINAGDSRLYVAVGPKRRMRLVQITKDHSLVQELYEQGKITREELSTHPYKNYILRALGTEERMSFDYFIVDYPFEYALLCTDGLTNFMNETEILGVLKSGIPVEEKVNCMIKSANDGGGGDNITAVLLHING